MRIFKDVTFEAAHRLPMLPVAHKCHHLHGHNYRVRVELDGPLDPMLGWVIDFAAIKVATDAVIGPLDHKYLNEIEGLSNPTAENIAQYILDRLRIVRMVSDKLKSVTVWETDDCGAIAE